MKQSIARVKSVKMKSGGASVSVISQISKTYLQRSIVQDAAAISSEEEGMTGYAIVAWSDDMFASVALNFSDKSPVHKDSIPSFVGGHIARIMRGDDLID